MNKNILFLFAIILFGISCRKEIPTTNQAVSLGFSADTIYLDTVFNTIGSSTYQLKVRNTSNERVIIDDIRIGGGNSSLYRLNIDGQNSNIASNVSILPQDSIYIFIEVTPNITAFPNPLYTDSILFTNKGRLQKVQLVTLTKDVIFHFPDKFIVLGNAPNATFIPYSVINCDDTWDNSKPHVIYGYAVVDSGCSLNITSGAEVFFHQNSGLWVFNQASLKIGENDDPSIQDSITFSGDRLEPFYENSPGQWGGVLGGIFIQGGSVNNVINNALIKNATTAVRLDSTSTQNLSMSNSYILNSYRVGIYGGFGNMKAENLVVANSGIHTLYVFGGDYEFRHCTFANYWNFTTRNDASVILTNFIDVIDANNQRRRLVRPLNNCYFGNCLVYGNNTQELSVISDPSNSFNYFFNHALLKIDTDESDRGFDISDPLFFNQILDNKDPDFVNIALNRYQLDSNSQAVNQGNISDPLIVPTDIIGANRNSDIGPDIGAYERSF